jgi:Ni/Co efflux regulator RcnB
MKKLLSVLLAGLFAVSFAAENASAPAAGANAEMAHTATASKAAKHKHHGKKSHHHHHAKKSASAA